MKKFDNILIIDDDSANNFITRRVLLKHNANNNIAIANNGQEGLDYLQDHNPDLILLDLNMPVMNGFEFMNNIKGSKLLKSCKIIVLTTSSDEKDIARMKSLGIKDYITKPLTTQKLEELLA